MTGTTRSSAGLDLRRKRLLFQAWHRGIREMDLLFGRFADSCIGELSDAELDRLEQLMTHPDPSVLAWMTGAEPIPAGVDAELVLRIGTFRED